LEPRVFVVDDDQSVRTRLAYLLAREDYAVEFFASAEEYLARVPHSGPACIVVEVHLPGLDGLALQQKLTEECRAEQIAGLLLLLYWLGVSDGRAADSVAAPPEGSAGEPQSPRHRLQLLCRNGLCGHAKLGPEFHDPSSRTRRYPIQLPKKPSTSKLRSVRQAGNENSNRTRPPV
jgi:Response regulator receiver domain